MLTSPLHNFKTSMFCYRFTDKVLGGKLARRVVVLPGRRRCDTGESKANEYRSFIISKVVIVHSLEVRAGASNEHKLMLAQERKNLLDPNIILLKESVRGSGRSGHGWITEASRCGALRQKRQGVVLWCS